jgi:hypothetical protein
MFYVCLLVMELIPQQPVQVVHMKEGALHIRKHTNDPQLALAAAAAHHLRCVILTEDAVIAEQHSVLQVARIAKLADDPGLQHAVRPALHNVRAGDAAAIGTTAAAQVSRKSAAQLCREIVLAIVLSNNMHTHTQHLEKTDYSADTDCPIRLLFIPQTGDVYYPSAMTTVQGLC